MVEYFVLYPNPYFSFLVNGWLEKFYGWFFGYTIKERKRTLAATNLSGRQIIWLE